MSLSEQLRELSDPRPVEFHPDQEDWDLLFGARLSLSRTYSDEGRLSNKRGGVSTLHRSRAKVGKPTDCESDPRYSGKPVSRTELYEYEQEDDGVELESESDQSNEELESGDARESDNESAGSDVVASETENNDNETETGAEDDDKITEVVGGSGFAAVDVDKVREEIEKGRAVRDQIKLWDGLLEGRIKLHKSLNLTNSLPRLSQLPVFIAAGGDRAIYSIRQVRKELMSLLDSLLNLQHSLLLRHRDTHTLVSTQPDESVAGSDEEIPSDSGSNEESSDREGEELAEERKQRQRRRRRKRKCPWRRLGYEEHISAVHTAFEGYRDDTIAKWDTKLRLASGKLTNKAFLHVDRSTTAQIKHVLQDRERLVKRTQLKRSVYHIMGRDDKETEEEESHDSHLRSHDQEIYDEDDFYHQLLRDLIERKMNYTESHDPVAMGRQWLALQKLRSKVKKKVDTKASKGRKIRYDVHPKLVGFMAPVEKGDMSNATRNDLFLSLFGAHSQQQ